MPFIEQTPERYLRSPRLEPVADGGALLHVIAWSGDQECILRFNVAEDGSVHGDSVATDHGTAIMGWAPGIPQPSDDPRAELQAEHQGWNVEVKYEGARSTVIVAPPSAMAAPAAADRQNARSTVRWNGRVTMLHLNKQGRWAPR